MTGPVRRVHFFAGQVLSSEDLQAEQDYHRFQRYLHNRLLGIGVVEGLDVTTEDDGTVAVSPGLAIDGLGREIVLAECVRLRVSEPAGPNGGQDVLIRWAEEPDSPLPSLSGAGDEPAFSRWLERPQLCLRPVDDQTSDGSLDASRLDSLVLGRVTPSAEGALSIDLAHRSIWSPRG